MPAKAARVKKRFHLKLSPGGAGIHREHIGEVSPFGRNPAIFWKKERDVNPMDLGLRQGDMLWRQTFIKKSVESVDLLMNS